MIVRILGEGQFRLDLSELGRLNELDARLEEATNAGDEGAFRQTLHDLLDAVRTGSAPVPDDELHPSDLILPPADASIDDVRTILSDKEGEGLIPN
ncbi:PspA-associated protein PspAA [Allonocardiopsis opalescens]|uniref:PspA-associated domain-containing protein n=1 Tax=Allonocardiopsis opalescens TaxID=1144618 RepID=A0A2T0PZT0_9ACTN|nr:hypothetical protein [Allonocardiopsis opalescens]PRX97062.1 hypothetical protein CLV72_10698 [Allonocardiopsis opalescens]